MKFRALHRVQVWSNAGRYLFITVPANAKHLIETKRATIELKTKAGLVQVVRLVEHQEISSVEDLRLWPGSYGVQRVTFGGGSYFQHKKHWGRDLQVAQ